MYFTYSMFATTQNSLQYGRFERKVSPLSISPSFPQSFPRVYSEESWRKVWGKSRVIPLKFGGKLEETWRKTGEIYYFKMLRSNLSAPDSTILLHESDAK